MIDINFHKRNGKTKIEYEGDLDNSKLNFTFDFNEKCCVSVANKIRKYAIEKGFNKIVIHGRRGRGDSNNYDFYRFMETLEGNYFAEENSEIREKGVAKNLEIVLESLEK